MMSPQEVQRRLDAARELAVEAGRSTLEHFQKTDLDVEQKKDKSPVTKADRNAEALIRKQLESRFPDDGVVGEEYGEQEGRNSVRWILDPIDGTKSFVSGVPLFGTMVGVEIEGQPLIGVVYLPGLDEGIFASRGDGAWHFRGGHEPVRASVSATTDLGDAVFVTSESETFSERNAGEVYQRLSQATWFSRTWGDCYGYLLVATGRVDMMIDPILNIWDAAAVSPIITEAGGEFVDWSGKSRIDAGEAIGTTKSLLPAVLEITRPYAGKF